MSYHLVEDWCGRGPKISLSRWKHSTPRPSSAERILSTKRLQFDLGEQIDGEFYEKFIFDNLIVKKVETVNLTTFRSWPHKYPKKINHGWLMADLRQASTGG